MPQSTSFRAVFGRLTWMLFGPMLLLLTTTLVVNSKGLFTIADLAFFLVLGAMAFGRWLEFRSGAPQTATGEPATQQDLRKYVIALGILGLLIWGGATMMRVLWFSN
jgi:hypothetical protein